MKHISFFLFAIGFFLVFPGRVFGMTLETLRTTVAAAPGETQLVSLSFFNDSPKDVDVVPSVGSFSIDQKSGATIFDNTDSAIAWVTPENSRMTLHGGERKNFSFSIVVPKEAEPGAHHLVLFFGEVGGGGQVGVSGQVGSLLFLQVAGVQHEVLTPLFFGADRFIFFSAPIRTKLSLRNDGTVQVTADGFISLSTQSGRRIATIPFATDASKTIFSGMTREYAYEFSPLSWRDVGPLRADVVLQYGVTHQARHDSFVLWYLPWQLCTASLAVLCIAGGILLFVRKKKRARL